MDEHGSTSPRSDGVDAAVRSVGMARSVSAIDKRVSIAVLHLSEAQGFTAISPERIAWGLGVTEGRVIASLRRLAARGLIRAIYQPNLAAMTALWSVPPDYLDRQDDGEES